MSNFVRDNFGGNSHWEDDEANILYLHALKQERLIYDAALVIDAALDSDNLPQIHTGLAQLKQRINEVLK